MDVLHLTDLHVGRERGLPALWRGVLDALPSTQLFDFVVVSGDLTDSAKTEEYDQLRDFLRTCVAPRLRKENEVERIILCPGNHDVDWSKQVTEDVASPPTRDDLKEHYRLPERSKLRVALDVLNASAKVVQIKPTQYADRFGNCANALSRFYEARLKTGDHREFRLTSEDAADHWSAHVFPDDEIAFYCFNSCFANDKHWRGAYIPQESITEAKNHAERHARGFIRVAVWHHGLLGVRGEPDFLSLAELGDLAGAGFDLGIHGHTHSDEQRDHFEDLGRRFPVIATGSFSAESSDRPDGVKNQASVLDLNETYLRFSLFNRDAKTSRWTRDRTREFQIRTREPQTRGSVTPKVEEHARTFTVDEDGIAKIEVKLRRLQLSDDFVLACPSATARLEYSPQATATILPTHGEGSTRPPTVLIDVLAGSSGSPPFYLIGSGQTLGELSWEYTTANAFALEGEELHFGDYTNRPDLKLLPGEDAVVHEVRAHTNLLSIRLHLPKDVIRKPQFRALRKEPHGEKWVDDPDEATRGKLDSGTAPARSVTAQIQHPRLGYRYMVSYELDRKRPRSDSTVDLMLPDLISACRDEPARSACSDALSVAIAAAIRGVRQLPDEEDLGYWVLYLWHPRTQLLLPCAGDFPARSWGTSFKYGSGIAGHTFRHMFPICYHADAMLGPNASTKARLVFLPGTPDGALHDHSWLVNLPVMRTKEGDAIGVLGFANYSLKKTGQFAEWLATTAAILCADPSRDHDPLFQLAHAVSAAFWQTVSRSSSVSATYQGVANKIYADHWMPPPTPTPSQTKPEG